MLEAKNPLDPMASRGRCGEVVALRRMASAAC